jgi:hypothetical protein
MASADTKDLFQRMLLALDGCTVALEAEANREKRAPVVNGLRKITAQSRLEHVEKLIAVASEHLDNRDNWS